MDKILVVDLGGQYAHMIANRLRRFGVLADISTPESINNDITNDSVRGIIFSGGPQSVYERGSPTVSIDIINFGLPILGICYGHQLIAYKLDGKVKPGIIKGFGISFDVPLLRSIGIDTAGFAVAFFSEVGTFIVKGPGSVSELSTIILYSSRPLSPSSFLIVFFSNPM